MRQSRRFALITLAFVLPCEKKNTSAGTEKKKNHDSRDVTGFYAYFSARKSGNFLHILGRFPYQITQKTWRKGKKSTGENSKKSSGGGAPKLQISVPCRGRTFPESFSLKNQGGFLLPKKQGTKKTHGF